MGAGHSKEDEAKIAEMWAAEKKLSVADRRARYRCRGNFVTPADLPAWGAPPAEPVPEEERLSDDAFSDDDILGDTSHGGGGKKKDKDKDKDKEGGGGGLMGALTGALHSVREAAGWRPPAAREGAGKGVDGMTVSCTAVALENTEARLGSAGRAAEKERRKVLARVRGLVAKLNADLEKAKAKDGADKVSAAPEKYAPVDADAKIAEILAAIDERVKAAVAAGRELPVTYDPEWKKEEQRRLDRYVELRKEQIAREKDEADKAAKAAAAKQKKKGGKKDEAAEQEEDAPAKDSGSGDKKKGGAGSDKAAKSKKSGSGKKEEEDAEEEEEEEEEESKPKDKDAGSDKKKGGSKKKGKDADSKSDSDSDSDSKSDSDSDSGSDSKSGSKGADSSKSAADASSDGGKKEKKKGGASTKAGKEEAGEADEEADADSKKQKPKKGGKKEEAEEAPVAAAAGGGYGGGGGFGFLQPEQDAVDIARDNFKRGVERAVSEMIGAMVDAERELDVIRAPPKASKNPNTEVAFKPSPPRKMFGGAAASSKKKKKGQDEVDPALVEGFPAPEPWLMQQRNSAQPGKAVEFKHNAALNDRICLVRADITSLELDGIVNAANSSLLGGGGIDGAIHRAAGFTLREECKYLNGAHTGETKTTRGYNLPAKLVLHTVGPVGERPGKLHQCYNTIAEQATTHKVKTLALCGVSSGIFGYPLFATAHVALYTIRTWMEGLAKSGKLKDIEKIVFCTFLPKELVAYEQLMPLYFPPEGETTSSLLAKYAEWTKPYPPPDAKKGDSGAGAGKKKANKKGSSGKKEKAGSSSSSSSSSGSDDDDMSFADSLDEEIFREEQERREREAERARMMAQRDAAWGAPQGGWGAATLKVDEDKPKAKADDAGKAEKKKDEDKPKAEKKEDEGKPKAEKKEDEDKPKAQESGDDEPESSDSDSSSSSSSSSASGKLESPFDPEEFVGGGSGSDDDIGLYGAHTGAVGTDLLRAPTPDQEGTADAADRITRQLQREKKLSADEVVNRFVAHERCFVDEAGRRALMERVDAVVVDDQADTKLVLTVAELEAVVGAAAVAEMQAAFGVSIDEVKLRRVAATPEREVINFHLDFAHRTMGIPLNDSTEYEGSRLLYAIPGEGVVAAPRGKAGSATVHDNTLPHGVTPLIHGVRYGLFLLNHTA